MVIKIVTDSASDLPPDVARQLGITVVPLMVRFGNEVYRDRVDLSSEEFYRRLAAGGVLPSTSIPSPRAFAEAYDRLAEETDQIVVITVTAKLSGTYGVALQAVGIMMRKCRVEVVDSGWAIMAQGLIAITAARAANAGAGREEVLALIERNKKRVDFRATFDTLEYLKRGGRIGRVQAFLGSMLKANPIIGLKEGEAYPFARERSRSRAVNHLYNFAMSYAKIEEIAIEDAATPDDAETLVERLSPRFPRERIFRAKASATVGTHTGPSLLVLTVLGDKQ